MRRAVDPHSFFGGSGPSSFFNADPDPASQNVIWGWSKFTYFLNEITITIDFLVCFYVFSLKFSPPGSVPRRENECGSGSTALVMQGCSGTGSATLTMIVHSSYIYSMYS